MQFLMNLNPIKANTEWKRSSLPFWKRTAMTAAVPEPQGDLEITEPGGTQADLEITEPGGTG